MAGGADRQQRIGRTPLVMRAGGTLYVRRAQPEQIFRDRFRLRQNAVKHHRPENRPLLLDRWVPTQNL
jgi:hypothetical protein